MTYDGIAEWRTPAGYQDIGTVDTVTVNLLPERISQIEEAMGVLKTAGIRWKPTFNCATFISVCLLHERIHTPDKLYKVLTELTKEG